MTTNPRFASLASWAEARALLDFVPLEPTAAEFRGAKLRIHLCDHRMRELAVADRTLEVHTDDLVFSQAKPGVDEARRLALTVSYGAAPQEAMIVGRPGRVYAPGPETPPDDIDGRMPAVVVWADGEMLYLLASGLLSELELVRIASELYR